MSKTNQEKRQRRRIHIRKKIFGTSETPRLSVFRSNRYLYVQLVDDNAGKTILGLSDKGFKSVKDEKPLDRAKRFGTEFGKMIAKKGVKTVIFDRGGYKYHGRIKNFADGVRESGIKF